jgi:hypothetical protein
MICNGGMQSYEIIFKIKAFIILPLSDKRDFNQILFFV